jgi:long-chain fatty acid transport protein
MAVGLAAALAIGTGTSVLADGFRNPPEGAGALARAGGRIVFTEDASAVAHNPANLVGGGGAQVMGAATFVWGEAAFDSPGGLSTTTEDPWKVLPNLFAAWPFADKRVALGLGLTTPFGQSTQWDENDPLVRYLIPHYAQMMALNVNPALAAKVIDRVWFGIGADILWSQLEMRQMFPWAQMLHDPRVPDGELTFKGDGVGVGGNLGLTWQITPKQRAALTYRSPIRVDYEGDFEAGNLPPGLPAPLDVLRPRSDFDTEIDFPAMAAVGYGIQVLDSLKLEANVEWIQFSSYEELSLDAAENNLLLHPEGDPNPTGPLVLEQDWNDIWTVGLSADWHLAEAWFLRGGYLYLPTPIPDRTFSPTLPDSNRHVLTAGVGFRHGHHAVDAAYALSLFEDRGVDNNVNPAYNGDYSFRSHLFGLSYAYAF